MAHVLIVALGPIQDFIAAARRSRDLWFGSWLLSELSKATAKAMADECGLEALVFPGVQEAKELNPGNGTSVANKIVVRVPDGKDPATVASLGKAGMETRLEKLRNEAFQQIDSRYFLRDPAEAQVADLIEYVWVSAPEESAAGYPEARARAESLLAARKNTRIWQPVGWGAEVPKSSIDGERESVLHENIFDRVGKEGGLTPQEVRLRYGVGPTERLCGVGLLKRHGRRVPEKYAHRFLSTGHLAAWPLYYRTKGSDDSSLKAAWNRYIQTLAEGGAILRELEIVQGGGWTHEVFGPYDASLLYENRLPEVFEEILDLDKRQAAIRKAKDALAAVLEKIGVSTPVPYYAILWADGDHMGKAIERQKTFQDHQRLSQALDQFARSVRTTVENEHSGELIYAGGDDVLAFVPLHKALACASALARGFSERLSEFKVDDQGSTPTLSAGIGISHFMDPMRGAIRLAEQAEKLAKKTRNSLAVIVDKRSGPPTQVSGVWGDLDARLKDYVWMHRRDQVPDGAAYELSELALLTGRVEGEDLETLEKLVKSEARRILKRKQPEHGNLKEIDEKVLRRLEQDIQGLPVREVSDRLIVARLLAQAEDQAGLPLQEVEP